MKKYSWNFGEYFDGEKEIIKKKKKLNALCPRSEEVPGEIQHPDSDVVALEMTEMGRETQWCHKSGAAHQNLLTTLYATQHC